MMADLIDRQAAIDAIAEGITSLTISDGRGVFDHTVQITDEALSDCIQIINELPTAEPEIIYCKDCKHFIRDDTTEYTCYGFYNEYFHAFCDKHWNEDTGEYEDVYLDDYCSFAERRTG